MNFKEIQDLIKLINKTNLSEFKLKDGDFELTIRSDEYHKSKANPPTQQVIPVPTTSPITPAFVPPVITPPSTSPEETETLPSKPEEKVEHIEIKSPIVGTFYRSPSPEKPPYVKIGDVIEEGAIVCIIEAMKLFNEIESEVSGKIIKVLVKDSSPVEYDQPLFLVDPNG